MGRSQLQHSLCFSGYIARLHAGSQLVPGALHIRRGALHIAPSTDRTRVIPGCCQLRVLSAALAHGRVPRRRAVAQLAVVAAPVRVLVGDVAVACRVPRLLRVRNLDLSVQVAVTRAMYVIRAKICALAKCVHVP
jgi:hypothetical protein